MSDRSDDEFDELRDDYSEQGTSASDNPDGPRTEVALPPARLLFLRPYLTVQWISAAAEGWLWTRAWLKMVPGLPFIAAAVWLIILVIETPGDLLDQINLLRGQIQDPESRNQPDLHELRLRALCGLLPNDHTPLLARAHFAVDEGRFDEAVQMMLRLSEWGELGIPEARMWLVKDALSATPHYRCSEDELERHLRMTLRVSPGLVEAHAALSSMLLNRGELLLAERSLAAAAELAPRYHLPLLQLRQSLGRQEVTNDAISKAIQKVAAAVSQHPHDWETRIAQARLHAMQHDFASAVNVLEVGRQLSDHAAFRRVIAELHTAHAGFLFDAGTLNRDQAAGLIIAALKLDPLNITAVELADRLARLDAWFPADLVAASTEKWKDAFQRLPDRLDVRLSLCRMLELNNEHAASLELLQPLLEQHPELHSKAVELMVKSGQLEAARSAAEKSFETLRNSPEDKSARRTAAECLMVLGDFPGVRRLLQTDENTLSSDPDEQLLFGIACLQEFDALCGRPRKAGPAADYWIPDFSALPAERPQQLVELLRQAGAVAPIRLDAADRLARIALLDHPVSQVAEQLILQFRARENQSAEILNQLGAHAILHERYEKARGWLEQGSLIAAGKNAAILNNLAIAILRGKLDNPQRALLLVNEALNLLPNNPEILSTRGEIHTEMKLWEDARKDLEQSLAARGGRPKVHRLLEKVFRGLLDDINAEAHRAAAEALEQANAASRGG
jgi:tetratricopeptide (TPR) repeat protein